MTFSNASLNKIKALILPVDQIEAKKALGVAPSATNGNRISTPCRWNRLIVKGWGESETTWTSRAAKP
jgi:hypothetical protein